MSVWDRSRGSLARANQATIALDRLCADLESLCMQNDGGIWLAATIQGDQTGTTGESGATFARWTAVSGGFTKPRATDSPGSLELQPDGTGTPDELQQLEEFRFGMAGVWLRFFTVEPDRNSGVTNLSAPRAVGYQILRYREAGARAPFQYGLFRTWTSPQHTLRAGLSLFDTMTSPSSTAEYNIGDASTAGVPGNIRRPRRDALLANNVVDFGVRIWCRDSGGNLVVRFPTRDFLGFAARGGLFFDGDPNTVPPSSAGAAPSFDEMAFGFPEEIEVFIRVLTDEGATQLDAFERGRIPGVAWWDLVSASSRVYTRRVRIAVRPL